MRRYAIVDSINIYLKIYHNHNYHLTWFQNQFSLLIIEIYQSKFNF